MFERFQVTLISKTCLVGCFVALDIYRRFGGGGELAASLPGFNKFENHVEGNNHFLTPR
jgi:hypothetical protein